MRNKIRSTFLMLSLLVAGLAVAQDRKPLSLDEAVSLGVKNSKQLKVSKARIDEAMASLREAEQRKLPDASLTGSYLRLSSANIDLKSADNGNNGGSGAPPPEVSQAMFGIVNTALPLYAGGRIRYGIESSRYLAQAASLDAENEKDAVIENTLEAYINLYKSRKAVDLVKQNLAEARQRVKELSSLEKNGVIARNDLMKAELQASNIELSLLDAENNWQVANVNMNLMLGLPEQTVLVPDSTSLFRQTGTAKPLNEYVQAALLNRKDLASLHLQQEAAETGVKAVKAEMYPSVQLSAGYVAADIPKVFTVTNAANIGLGVSYNIGSLWKNKAKVQGANARARQLVSAQEVLNDQIRLQVNRSYLNWLSSQKKIEVYAKAIEQATENFRITNNKYTNSLATTTELLDADVALLQANLNYEMARADAIVSYHQLLQAAGEETIGGK